jgi:hypothetical protein
MSTKTHSHPRCATGNGNGNSVGNISISRRRWVHIESLVIGHAMKQSKTLRGCMGRPSDWYQQFKSRTAPYKNQSVTPYIDGEFAMHARVSNSLRVTLPDAVATRNWLATSDTVLPWGVPSGDTRESIQAKPHGGTTVHILA